MWKVYDDNNDDDDRQTTESFWSEKLTWTFGSGELKTQTIWNIFEMSAMY